MFGEDSGQGKVNREHTQWRRSWPDRRIKECLSVVEEKKLWTRDLAWHDEVFW